MTPRTIWAGSVPTRPERGGPVGHEQAQRFPAESSRRDIEQRGSGFIGLVDRAVLVGPQAGERQQIDKLLVPRDHADGVVARGSQFVGMLRQLLVGHLKFFDRG